MYAYRIQPTSQQLLQIKKREIVSESVYPVLDVRFVGGLRRVREMTDSHQFEPVIPSYNYMDTEQASDYYTSSTRYMGRIPTTCHSVFCCSYGDSCTWWHHRGGARLPIITGYELLRRCSQVECEKVKVTLNIDGLPSYNGPLDDSAPANTSAPSPCKPPAHTCQPLVLESYHEWLRKDSGLEK